MARASLMLLVNGGMRRSNAANAIIVLISIGALLIFSLHALFAADTTQQTNALDFSTTIGDSMGWREFLGAAALLFVAYTGYGRIATMGEEVSNPKRTIPIAIVMTLVVTTALYLLIGYALLHTDLFTQGAGDSQLALIALTEQGWLRALVLGGVACRFKPTLYPKSRFCTGAG